VSEIAELAHVNRPESGKPENAVPEFVGRITEHDALDKRNGI